MSAPWRLTAPAPVVAALYAPHTPEGVEPGFAVAGRRPASLHPVTQPPLGSGCHGPGRIYFAQVHRDAFVQIRHGAPACAVFPPWVSGARFDTRYPPSLHRRTIPGIRNASINHQSRQVPARMGTTLVLAGNSGTAIPLRSAISIRAPNASFVS